MILTDPPYNTAHKNTKVLKGRKDISMDFGAWDYFEDDDFLKFSKVWLEQCYPVLKEGGNLLTFCKLEYVSDIRRIYERIGYRHHGTVIWHKTNPVPKIRKTGFLSACEAVLWATKGFDDKKVPYTFNFLSQKEMHNFVESPICMGKQRTKHPTQKPLQILKHFINVFTDPNDMILDIFAGAGSTAVAAQSMGRRSVCIENNKDYFEIMKANVLNNNGDLFTDKKNVHIVNTKAKLENFLCNGALVTV